MVVAPVSPSKTARAPEPSGTPVIAQEAPVQRAEDAQRVWPNGELGAMFDFDNFRKADATWGTHAAASSSSSSSRGAYSPAPTAAGGRNKKGQDDTATNNNNHKPGSANAGRQGSMGSGRGSASSSASFGAPSRYPLEVVETYRGAFEAQETSRARRAAFDFDSKDTEGNGCQAKAGDHGSVGNDSSKASSDMKQQARQQQRQDSKSARAKASCSGRSKTAGMADTPAVASPVSEPVPEMTTSAVAVAPSLRKPAAARREAAPASSAMGGATEGGSKRCAKEVEASKQSSSAKKTAGGTTTTTSTSSSSNTRTRVRTGGSNGQTKEEMETSKPSPPNMEAPDATTPTTTPRTPAAVATTATSASGVIEAADASTSTANAPTATTSASQVGQQAKSSSARRQQEGEESAAARGVAVDSNGRAGGEQAVADNGQQRGQAGKKAKGRKGKKARSSQAETGAALTAAASGVDAEAKTNGDNITAEAGQLGVAEVAVGGERGEAELVGIEGVINDQRAAASGEAVTDGSTTAAATAASVAGNEVVSSTTLAVTGSGDDDIREGRQQQVDGEGVIEEAAGQGHTDDGLHEAAAIINDSTGGTDGHTEAVTTEGIVGASSSQLKAPAEMKDGSEVVSQQGAGGLGEEAEASTGILETTTTTTPNTIADGTTEDGTAGGALATLEAPDVVGAKEGEAEASSSGNVITITTTASSEGAEAHTDGAGNNATTVNGALAMAVGEDEGGDVIAGSVLSHDEEEAQGTGISMSITTTSSAVMPGPADSQAVAGLIENEAVGGQGGAEEAAGTGACMPSTTSTTMAVMADSVNVSRVDDATTTPAAPSTVESTGHADALALALPIERLAMVVEEGVGEGASLAVGEGVGAAQHALVFGPDAGGITTEQAAVVLDAAPSTTTPAAAVEGGDNNTTTVVSLAGDEDGREESRGRVSPAAVGPDHVLDGAGMGLAAIITGQEVETAAVGGVDVGTDIVAASMPVSANHGHSDRSEAADASTLTTDQQGADESGAAAGGRWARSGIVRGFGTLYDIFLAQVRADDAGARWTGRGSAPSAMAGVGEGTAGVLVMGVPASVDGEGGSGAAMSAVLTDEDGGVGEVADAAAVVAISEHQTGADETGAAAGAAGRHSWWARVVRGVRGAWSCMLGGAKTVVDTLVDMITAVFRCRTEAAGVDEENGEEEGEAAASEAGAMEGGQGQCA